MPLTREIKKIENFQFTKPVRAIFSGSSQSGKTFLIGKVLENQQNLFGDKYTFVKYFYPTYLDESPVEYHQLTDTPISYEPGFPTKNDVLSMPENSLLIIDDQADEAVKSDLISQLFKVISGKKNISVILVTQNYFIQGKHSRDIRNSCNYVALFRNCADASLNKRVATAFGLKNAYQAAERDIYYSQVYPYVFIDQTQRAQLSNFRLYTEILAQFKIAYNTDGMRGYILNEIDFSSAFRILENKKLVVLAANKNENQKNKISESTTSDNSEEKAEIKREKKRRRKEKRRHVPAERDLQ